jgi:hypothetical protein
MTALFMLFLAIFFPLILKVLQGVVWVVSFVVTFVVVGVFKLSVLSGERLLDAWRNR